MNLLTILEKKGVSCDMLDELVYDHADTVASQVNNEGLEAQVSFLQKAGLSNEEILAYAALEDMA
jgi:hypothetical protein